MCVNILKNFKIMLPVSLREKFNLVRHIVIPVYYVNPLLQARVSQA